MFTTRSPRATSPGLALAVIATAQLMVVLDATIVNVALPHIQRALGFSGNGLEWVITAYALSFGGLLLLGGRAGDLLGRRRVFMSGLLLFLAASFVGGFATSQSWLLAARAFQGAGGALIAPTALALVATNFAEGPARNRAMGFGCRYERSGGRGRPGSRWPAHHLPVLAVGAVRQRAHRCGGGRRRARGAGRIASAAGPVRPGRGDHRHPSEWPCWSTASQTPAPISTAYPTGVTTRSWPPWWRRPSFLPASC